MPPRPHTPLTLGQRLKKLRESKKWTISRLAAASGVGIGSISELENGVNDREPNFATIRSLASALSVKISKLTGE